MCTNSDSRVQVLVNNNVKALSTDVSPHVPKISWYHHIKKNKFATPATKTKRKTTDANIVKMIDIDINKLRAANTTWPSETETLFSNEFTSFFGCRSDKWPMAIKYKLLKSTIRILNQKSPALNLLVQLLMSLSLSLPKLSQQLRKHSSSSRW